MGTETGIASAPPDSAFAAYWFQGEAELTGYRLEQVRYGETRIGEAVLIFVTEALSRTEQVKLNRPGAAGSDRVDVMKLNMTRRFQTGVYPYSMMTSVFTPLRGTEEPHSLKVTTSSQEWCGHTFTQLNLRDGGYDVRLSSYFEGEGDVEDRLPPVLLEDELWTRLRMDPAAMPVGAVRMLPGTMYQRLSHSPLRPMEAEASLSESPDGLQVYRIAYKETGRSLAIFFDTEFPHTIEGWEESNADGALLSRAERLARTNMDYWTRNAVEDESLRAELGL